MEDSQPQAKRSSQVATKGSHVKEEPLEERMEEEEEEPVEEDEEEPVEEEEEEPMEEEEESETTLVPPTVSSSPQPPTKTQINTRITDMPLSPLDIICQSMDASGLRIYICNPHTGDGKLKKMLPALKRASNPARLILSTVCEILVAPQKDYRSLVSLLLFFLDAFPRVEPDASLHAEADEVALRWRERMAWGPAKDEFMGLALFVSCFGVPEEFGLDYLCVLLRGSMKCRQALRQSYTLLTMMPDIVKYMTTTDMEVEAVDLICSFGLENKFPVLPLLSSVVQKCNDKVEESGNLSTKDPMMKRLAISKKIDALNYAKRCIRIHKIYSNVSSLGIDNTIRELRSKMATMFAKEKKRGYDQLMEDSQPQAKRSSQFATKRSHVEEEEEEEEKEEPMEEEGEEPVEEEEGEEPVEEEEESETTLVQPTASSSPQPPKKPQINTRITNMPLSPLDIICQSMDASGLRVYICNPLNRERKLKKELRALKRASNPARLFLSTIRQILDAPQKDYKSLVSLLLLFLDAFPRVEPDASLQAEADEVALRWKERMAWRPVKDGFMGLALFVACFGVPEEFGLEYLCVLLRGSMKSRQALRQSYTLHTKMPEIVKYMMTTDMEVEAVDLICSFELENKFPVLPLLSSVVQTCNNKVEESGNLSSKDPKTERKAIFKKIEALYYAKKCIRVHKLYPHGSSLGIDSTISKLQSKMMATKFAEGKKRGYDQLVEDSEPQAKRSHFDTNRSHVNSDRSGCIRHETVTQPVEEEDEEEEEPIEEEEQIEEGFPSCLFNSQTSPFPIIIKKEVKEEPIEEDSVEEEESMEEEEDEVEEEPVEEEESMEEEEEDKEEPTEDQEESGKENKLALVPPTSSSPPQLPKKHQINTQIPNRPLSSLGIICQSMDASGLLDFICNALGNRKLKKVCGALKLASNPARLFLSTVHEFHSAPQKDYKHVRKLLHLFLHTFPRIEPDASLRAEADKVARRWRDRIVGRVRRDAEDEFMGLALFVACFGVPEEFGLKYLCCLLGGSLTMRETLKHSFTLLTKMPDIVKYMTKTNMEVEAVDLICTFGLENEFPVYPLLSAFVLKTCNAEVEKICNLTRKAILRKIEALNHVKRCINIHCLPYESSLGIDLTISQLRSKKTAIKIAKKKIRDEIAKRKIRDDKLAARPAQPRRSLRLLERSKGKIDEPDTGHATGPQATCPSKSGTPYSPQHDFYRPPPGPYTFPYPSAYMYQQPSQASYSYYPLRAPLPCEPSASNFPQQPAAAAPSFYRCPVPYESPLPYPAPYYGSIYPYNM